ncbi:alanine dehydrogenase [Halorubrum gandharaense]
MRVLSDDDIAALLDLDDLLDVTADALRAQGRGDVERPPRPHFPVGRGLVDAPGDSADGGAATDPCGTGLVMPAYIHGADHYATKVAGIHDGNVERGLPTVNASITLTAADTGLPAAVLAGNRITNARTGCIGGLAARELAVRSGGGNGIETGVVLGVLGAGEQARWQTHAIRAAVGVKEVRVHSPSDSREACASDLREAGIDARAVDTPQAAVTGADVVVTATTATEPTFDGDDLQPGALVVAVGAYTAEMRELDDRTIERAAACYADVPAEAAETGDFPGHTADGLVPFSAVLSGDHGRASPTDVVVVASVGTAVLDAAAGEYLLNRAKSAGLGRELPL